MENACGSQQGIVRDTAQETKDVALTEHRERCPIPKSAWTLPSKGLQSIVVRRGGQEVGLSMRIV